MGIVHDPSKKYITESTWKSSISQQLKVNALTPQNIKFLKRIGLKVVRDGAS